MLSVLAGLAALTPCYGQPSSTVALSNGVQLSIESNVSAGTGQQNLQVEMAPATGDSFYRIFRDQNRLAVFAYELAVGRSGDDQFRVVAKPVETDFAAQFPNADGGKPVPTLSADLALPLLSSKQSAEIGLFEMQGMGTRVTDKVTVVVTPPEAVDDGEPAVPAMQLRFAGLRVSVNGESVAPPQAGSAVMGRYAMFYIPRKGGYFFSAEASPGPGFVKAGTIDGTHMQFTLENDTYDCRASLPFLTDGGSGEVWVYHVASYRPAGNWTQATPLPAEGEPVREQFFTAAADTLRWWLR